MIFVAHPVRGVFLEVARLRAQVEQRAHANAAPCVLKPGRNVRCKYLSYDKYLTLALVAYTRPGFDLKFDKPFLVF